MSGRMIRIVGVLAVFLGVLLLAVPVASADSPRDYPNVAQDDTATPPPDWFEREVAKATLTEAVRPDDLPGPRGPGTVATGVRPDDLAGARGPGAVSAEPTVIATSEGGFDWTDAAIVGGAVLGIVLVVGLGVWMGTGHWPTTGRHAPT